MAKTTTVYQIQEADGSSTICRDFASWSDARAWMAETQSGAMIVSIILDQPVDFSSNPEPQDYCLSNMLPEWAA